MKPTMIKNRKPVTVADLIEWLGRFPKDAEVEVKGEDQGDWYTYVKDMPMDISEGGTWYLYDFTKPDSDKNHSCYGRKILTLGE